MVRGGGFWWLGILCWWGKILSAIPTETEGMAARVNDDIITTNEVLRLLRPSLRKVTTSSLPEEEKRRQVDRLWRAQLRDLVSRRVLLQAARERKVEITDAQVEEAFQQRVEKAGGRKDFEEILRQEDQSPAEFKEELREELMTVAYMEQESGLRPIQAPRKKPPADETERGKKEREEKELRDSSARLDLYVMPGEMRRYYEEHPEEFTVEEEWRFRQIQRTAMSDEILVKSLARQLELGGDFALLAHAYSQDPYREEGGLWPWTRPSALRQELRAALEGLEPGGGCRLVSSPLGWQLLKMEEKRASRKKGFGEVQHLIENRLYHEKFKENIDRVARQLVRRAYVYPPDLFGDED